MKPAQSPAKHTAVEKILRSYDETTSALAFQLRDFLLQHLDNISELPDNTANIIGYGYGPGYKELICTIMLSKQGVKLGFYKGTELPDPAHLLTGSGKVHKFVAIRTANDILEPALKNLLDEALKAYRKRKDAK